jgi:hypothetical protein
MERQMNNSAAVLLLKAVIELLERDAPSPDLLTPLAEGPVKAKRRKKKGAKVHWTQTAKGKAILAKRRGAGKGR